MTETAVYTGVQTSMFLWKIDLRILDFRKLTLFSPHDQNFCVTIDMTNTIPSIEFRNEITEQKNRKFQECTIYMMDQAITTTRQIFNGFGKHNLYYGKSISECCFLFEIKMECKSVDVGPVVWMRGSTFVNPKIITNETEKSTITARSIKFAKMEYHEIAKISIIIKAFQSIVAVKRNNVKHSECIEDPLPLSCLYAYFSENKFCDFTVHVKDQSIRAHKLVLANGSTVWHDMLLADETLSSVNVDDFEHETIKDLIVFTYTGIIKKEAATDQLLKAADKFGVIPLKARCETLLLEAINLKTATNLLVLAHQYNATKLFSAAMAFIGENRAEFRELQEMKSIFMTYPELGHTLFAEFF